MNGKNNNHARRFLPCILFAGGLLLCVASALHAAELRVAWPALAAAQMPLASGGNVSAQKNGDNSGRLLPRFLHSLKRIAAVLLLAYCGLCIYIFLAQSNLVYFPERNLQVTPSALGLEFEDVFINTPDGGRIHAWFIPASGEMPRPENALTGTVLFCHGNAGNIGDRLDTVRNINQMGLDLLLFDYRGYGRSSGRPSETRTYEDGMAAWNHLVRERGLKPEQIIVWGRSLGGAIAAHVAEQRRPGALILESTFTSTVDMGREIYPFLPVSVLARIRYPVLQRLHNLRGIPLIIVHSPHDQVIPFHHSRKLYEAAGEPKFFLEIQGGHNDGFINSGNVYVSGLRQALAEYGFRAKKI